MFIRLKIHPPLHLSIYAELIEIFVAGVPYRISEVEKGDLDPRHRLLMALKANPVRITSTPMTIAANAPTYGISVMQDTVASYRVVELSCSCRKRALSSDSGTFLTKRLPLRHPGRWRWRWRWRGGRRGWVSVVHLRESEIATIKWMMLMVKYLTLEFLCFWEGAMLFAGD